MAVGSYKNQSFYDDSGENAQVITKWRFQMPNGSFNSFMDYTNRAEAVSMDNDYTVNEEEHLDRYMDYTNRAAAVEEDVDDLTTAFDSTGLNLTKKQLSKKRKEVKIAEKNGNPMQLGVVSFRSEFLEENGVIKFLNGDKNDYSLKNRIVDQKKLKAVIQKSMTGSEGLLTKEGFTDEVTWWGNIHLNKDDVHVHIAITEPYKSNREIKDNGEVKGTLSKKSIDIFKKNIYEAFPEANRLKDINQRVGMSFDKTFKQQRDVIKNNDYLNTKLSSLFTKLPSDTSKWRYKSNAADFKPAKKILDDYVDDFLDSGAADEFKINLAEQARQYNKAFGDIRTDFTDKQMKKLRERLAQDVLNQLKQIPEEEITELSVDSQKINDLTEDELVQVAADDSDAKRSSAAKVELRQRNLTEQLNSIGSMSVVADSILDEPSKAFFQKDIKNKKRLINISKQITNKRSKADKDFLKKYGFMIKNVDAVSIDYINQQRFTDWNSYLKSMKATVSNAKNKDVRAMSQIIANNQNLNKQQLILELDRQTEVLDIKNQMSNNAISKKEGFTKLARLNKSKQAGMDSSSRKKSGKPQKRRIKNQSAKSINQIFVVAETKEIKTIWDEIEEEQARNPIRR